jgi:hypothetical protein
MTTKSMKWTSKLKVLIIIYFINNIFIGCEQTILEMRSTIIELKEFLHKKEDVEKQLEMARGYIAELESQRL